jgi:hypothetical protein
LGLVFSLIVLAVPASSYESGKGGLVGFVFEQDGTTPVAGAVVAVRNVTTGTVRQSDKSDGQGVFRFPNLEAGIYALGVSSGQGDFNAADVVGVAPNETAKVTVTLSAFEPAVASAAQQVAKDQKEKGESWIGRVIAYNPAAKQAEISIERGLLQVGDKIHVLTAPRGQGTDFFQEARVLMVSTASVKRILVGQRGLISLEKPALPNDDVYVSCKRGVPPFFLLPLGVALVAGGAAIVNPPDEPTGTPFKVNR